MPARCLGEGSKSLCVGKVNEWGYDLPYEEHCFGQGKFGLPEKEEWVPTKLIF